MSLFGFFRSEDTPFAYHLAGSIYPRQHCEPWNHKRVHRVYRLMGLNLPRRTKRRVPARERQPLIVPPEPDRMWPMDLMHDTLACGKSFRTLNVFDEGVREVLAIEVDGSLPAGAWKRVARVKTVP